MIRYPHPLFFHCSCKSLQLGSPNHPAASFDRVGLSSIRGIVAVERSRSHSRNSSLHVLHAHRIKLLKLRARQRRSQLRIHRFIQDGGPVITRLQSRRRTSGKRCGKRLHRKRLQQKIIKPTPYRLLRLTPTHSQQRGSIATHRAQPPSQFVPRSTRHLHIHQHHVRIRPRSRQMQQRRIARIRRSHSVTRTLKQHRKHLPAHLIIIHHENSNRNCVIAHQRKDYQLDD